MTDESGPARPAPSRVIGAHPESTLMITVDGEAVPAVPGQTIGAAMTAAGYRWWRTTRHDRRPRGLFCGIGVCFDCLITVNDRPCVRACLAEAQPGDVVDTTEPSRDRKAEDTPDATGGAR